VDWTALAISSAAVGVPVAIFGLWWWKKQREIDGARQWPQTEATIESATIETYAGSRSGTVELPTFGFSYGVAGQYYSGRFSLMPYDDPRESLLVRMAGRKLLVHYDPEHPEIWFISDAIIEGCKVQQKMGPRLVALYPK
jgi:hypothetical protein